MMSLLSARFATCIAFCRTSFDPDHIRVFHDQMLRFQCTLCEVVSTKPNIFNPRRATEGRRHKRLQSSCPSWTPKCRLIGGRGGHSHITSIRHTATKQSSFASFTFIHLYISLCCHLWKADTSSRQELRRSSKRWPKS